MEKFLLYEKKTEKPHFFLIIGKRAWIVPFPVPFEAGKRRLAIEAVPDAGGEPQPASGLDFVESGRVVINNEREGKFGFTVVSNTGSVITGNFVFILPSWGRNTKRRLWLLVKSKKQQGERQC